MHGAYSVKSIRNLRYRYGVDWHRCMWWTCVRNGF
jgi:hypothetical protein